MSIPPGQTINLPVSTRKSATYESTDMMVEMTHNIKGIDNSPILVTLRNNTTLERFTVPVKNVSQHPITIQADKILFNLKPITDITTVLDIQCQMTNCMNGDDKTNKTEDNIKKLTVMTKLEAEQKDEFANLLKQYSNLFACNDNDSGQTTVVKHKIPLKDDTFFKDRVRRIPPDMFEEVKTKIEEMLKSGVIQPSHSSWNSNIVLALKKDSTWRLCTEFRQINNCTVTGSYRLTCLEETLDKLAGAKYITCLDLKNGYWQIEIEESDKHKTAFSVPGVGFFEYNWMPFGLCSAPATFQHLMEQVLYYVNNKICAIYLDFDMEFHSQKHLERLEAVFKRLADAGLKLKPSKCTFFQEKTGYIGHVISSNGAETDPLKI